MSPTAAPDAVTTDPRTWPVTAALVVVGVVGVVGVVLMLAQGFVAAMTTAPFFGDTPSRDEYISAGMTALTTLPVFAAMIWCGWQRGSRRGLWLIGGPSAVMALSGLNLVATTGDARDPHPTRTLGVGDLFAGGAPLNWLAFAVFAGLTVGTHLLRRRARHTESGSAA